MNKQCATVASDSRVNVYKVAEKAGVSPGTVSRVLNNRGRVHADTSKRVFEAARVLGFRPQVQVRTKQVAVLSENIGRQLRNWGYYQIVWSHTAFALNKRGMTMVVPDDPAELRSRHLDGVIVTGGYSAVRPLVLELQQHVPVVLTDDFSNQAGSCHVVRSDQRQAGRLAAERFLKTGRRRLGFVGSPGAQEEVILAGYREAMREAGVEVNEELFVMRNQEVNFYGAVSRVIQLGADALFIPGDNFEAMEGMNVIRNVLCRRIPEDVALIGGEIHGVTPFVTPPMTAIESPLCDVATRAVETLDLLMRKKHAPMVQDLPVRLLVRQSA